MIYLASPYFHQDPLVMQFRFQAVQEAVAAIMRSGCAVYSPIAHNHPLALQFDLPHGWDFWAQMDLPILAKSSRLWVLCLSGWQGSVGVNAERDFAALAGIPITYIEPGDWKWQK